MAEDAESDDQWLYGDQHDIPQEEQSLEQEPTKEPTPPPKENGTESPPNIEENEENEDTNKEDQEESKEDGDVDEKDDGGDDAEQQNGEDEDLDDDDSDDDVNVVIGDIKSTPSYSALNIKRGNLLTSTGDKSKQLPQSGKFAVEEFDQAGMINGVPATEYNLDSLEDKPWRKPGADLTDYFNYGFNEDTWRAYCERQKRMRVNESGVGLAAQINPLARGAVPIMNDNSKYSGNFLGVRKAGPPPGRRMTGSIDVIGGIGQRVTPTPVGKIEPPKMNVIQVMTADRREYSRKPGAFPDMSVPPPTSFEEFQPEYGFNPEPEPFYGSYEPTQDSQWGTDNHPPNWVPTGPPPSIGSNGPPPAMQMGPPSMNATMPSAVPSPRSKDRSPSKEREHSRSRSERRERSHRRDRSRSRSKRHKSRSRSPTHRSHRKKKSRRHDDSE